jgi:hypothetical protein
MSDRLDTFTWSKQAAIAWIRTRDEEFTKQIAGADLSDVNLELRLSLRLHQGKWVHPAYDAYKAKTLLTRKIRDGSIRTLGGKPLAEHVRKEFPRFDQFPASSARVHDQVEVDTRRSEIKPTRHTMTEKSAVTFTEQYLKDMRAKELRPTQKGLVEAANAEGFSGGRQLLRDEFKKRLGAHAPGRGRPRGKRNSTK